MTIEDQVTYTQSRQRMVVVTHTDPIEFENRVTAGLSSGWLLYAQGCFYDPVSKSVRHWAHMICWEKVEE